MKKMICFALVVTMMCALFVGCESESDMSANLPHNVACVVTIANNNPPVDVDMIDELSALPGLPGSTYVVINAEGQPRVICEGEIPDFADRGYSKVMLERIQASITADINGQIETAAPCTPQVDIAGAVSLAVRNLHANTVDGRENLLVIYGSGISSTGLIDMTTVPVYQMDVDASVSTLTDMLNLDLAGIEVVFYACGDVSGDQTSLSSVEQAKLKEFYQELFLGMGADSVTFMADIPNGECYNFDHQVSVMLTKGGSSGLQASTYDPAILESNEGDDAFAEPVVLTESQVEFIGDKADYLYPEEAESVLKPISEYLMSNDITILLVGTTAGDSSSANTYTMRLSLARAETVKRTLVDFGVDPSRIIAVGLGSTDPWHVPGISVSDPASCCNRKVVILDASSQTAQEILAGINE